MNLCPSVRSPGRATKRSPGWTARLSVSTPVTAWSGEIPSPQSLPPVASSSSRIVMGSISTASPFLPVPSAPPGFQGLVDDGLAQLLIADAHGGGLLGHQAGGGHPGVGVDLQEPGGAYLVHDEVRPGVH